MRFVDIDCHADFDLPKSARNDGNANSCNERVFPFITDLHYSYSLSLSTSGVGGGILFRKRHFVIARICFSKFVAIYCFCIALWIATTSCGSLVMTMGFCRIATLCHIEASFLACHIEGKARNISIYLYILRCFASLSMTKFFLWIATQVLCFARNDESRVIVCNVGGGI